MTSPPLARPGPGVNDPHTGEQGKAPHAHGAAGSAGAGFLAELRAAIAFATVVPVPAAGPPGPLAIALFPLVGAGVGIVAGSVRLLADGALGSGASALLAALALVILTGALHLDGLADCADALGARGREARLRALRDPRLGTFGVVAVVAWLGCVQAALARLESGEVLVALAATTACARFAAVVQGSAARAARSEGLGAGFAPAGGTLLGAAGVALAAALALALVATWGWALGVALVVAAGITGSASGALATRAFGGRTGDTLGAAIAVFEAVALLACAATLA